MRTALLSAIRRDEEGELRASSMFLGRSVLAWQADWAWDLGCERVICLCENPGETVVSLQRDIEARGGEFHAIRSNLQLVGLVRAEEELVILLDGLVPDRKLLEDWQRSSDQFKPSISTLPADHNLASEHPDDFERIDRDRRWAGIAALKAGQVHKLADLPPDGDAVSLLLRLGLQARVPCEELSPNSFGTGEVLFANSQKDVARSEPVIVETGSAALDWKGPGRALATLIVRKMAPNGIPFGVEAGFAAGVLFFLIGIALSVLGHLTAALICAGLGAFGVAFGSSWRAMRATLWRKRSGSKWRVRTRIASDLAILLILLFPSILLFLSEGRYEVEILALPIIAIGLSHVMSREGATFLSAWWSDRTSHALLFAAFSAFGSLADAIAAFALLALASIFLEQRENGLTGA